MTAETRTPRSRSQSLSTVLAPTSPLPLASPLSPTSLRFSALSLSPSTLQSDEFIKAYHHARSASFNGSASSSLANNSGGSVPLGINTSDAALWASASAGGGGGLSVSPTLSASTVGEDRLLTPSSSPPATFLYPLQIPSTKPGRTTSLKGGDDANVIHEGVEEGVEMDHGVAIMNPPASSSLFSNGARWGWPQTTPAGGAGASPPSGTRRASLGLAGTDGRAYPMMAPLGRVVSAGAGPSGAASSGKTGGGGFDLFRRLSVGGFGGKVS